MTYPAASYVGIDVSPRAGRLFSGDRARAVFRQQTIEALADAEPASFDMVLICDVVHHIAPNQREVVLRAAARALAPGGALVVKDWERRPNLIYVAGWISDIVVSRSQAWFLTHAELKDLVLAAVPEALVERDLRLPPWPNNMVLMMRVASERGTPRPSTPSSAQR